ncbi:MAG: hypothetical protein KGQ59_08030, partial [Bdellovibrionales bacterium]|nr:hypothetical protein [Bdellovibrionales bacterium]
RGPVQGVNPMKKNVKTIIKLGVMALGIMLVPLLGHAGFETVTCSTRISAFLDQPERVFAAQNTSFWNHLELEARRARQTQAFRRGEITRARLMKILAEVNATATAMSYAARKQARTMSVSKLEYLIEAYRKQVSSLSGEEVTLPKYVIACSGDDSVISDNVDDKAD